MRAHVKKKLWRRRQREMTLGGNSTTSEGTWTPNKSLEGRAGCRVRHIRSVQAGYKVPRPDLYT